MPSRYMRRTILCVAPALAAGVLAACGGRGPLDTDIESYDSADAAGLTTPGDDEIEPGGDSGTRPTKPLDGGADSKEAGTPGSPGRRVCRAFQACRADAGGIVGCFACAEDSCGTQVNACVGSPACVEEGTCDLMCLGGGTTGGGLADGGTTGGGLAGGGIGGPGRSEPVVFPVLHQGPAGEPGAADRRDLHLRVVRNPVPQRPWRCWRRARGAGRWWPGRWCPGRPRRHAGWSRRPRRTGSRRSRYGGRPQRPRSRPRLGPSRRRRSAPFASRHITTEAGAPCATGSWLARAYEPAESMSRGPGRMPTRPPFW